VGSTAAGEKAATAKRASSRRKPRKKNTGGGRWPLQEPNRPQERVAECLVKHRARDEHFLVKWVGYPHLDNSWEPKARLPPTLVAAWRSHGGRSPTPARWRANAGPTACRVTSVKRPGLSHTFSNVLEMVKFIGGGRSTIYKKFPKNNSSKAFECVGMQTPCTSRL
jgi:hypothetical protein